MIKGIIFDLDGTLTEFNLDIQRIKRAIGKESEKTILDILDGLEALEREKAELLLEKYECEAARKAELREGVKELFDCMKKKKLKVALVTRNNRKAVRIIAERFGLDFDAVVTRGDAKPKPSKKQLELALEKMDLKKEEVIFVGDHKFDVDAGRRAGISTYLLRSEFHSDMPKTIKSFGELRNIIGI